MSAPQTHTFSFTFSHVPIVLKRGQHVLIALLDGQGRVLLGHKKIYPAGIFRMVGGGIEVGESPTQGAVRELKEETGLEFSETELKPVAEITTFSHEGETNQDFKFRSWIFTAQLSPEQEVVPGDDVHDVVWLDKTAFEQLLVTYATLLPELQAFPRKDDPQTNDYFRWSDYGQFFGRVHQILYDYLLQQKYF